MRTSSGLRSGLVAAWVAAVAASLAACASATGEVGYPAGWAPLSTEPVADGCPDVSGTYANTPSGAVPAQGDGAPSLSEVFDRMGSGRGLASPAETGRRRPQATGATLAQLQLTPWGLEVAFVAADGVRTTLEFRRYHFSWAESRYDDLFTCHPAPEGPRLRFLASPESHSGGIPYVFLEGGGTLVFLLKARDGSLVVHWRRETLRVTSIVVGSRMKYESTWWRYPAVPSQATSANTPPAEKAGAQPQVPAT